MDKKHLITGESRQPGSVAVCVAAVLLQCVFTLSAAPGVANPCAADLEAAVSTGFPDVLSGRGRCNAPLLVDWLVDTAFTAEDAQPPVVSSKG